MAKQELNFRSTVGYRTDDSIYTHVITSASNLYPIVTAQGFTVGYVSNSSVERANSSTLVDVRLAGIHRVPSSIPPRLFRVSLPNAGSYDIRLAVGSTSFVHTGRVRLFDDSIEIATLVDQIGQPANTWSDANNFQYTDVTWPTSNTPYQHTFTSTEVYFHLENNNGGATLDARYLAHISIESSPIIVDTNPDSINISDSTSTIISTTAIYSVIDTLSISELHATIIFPITNLIDTTSDQIVITERKASIPSLLDIKSNLRIVYNNLVESAISISASTTAGGLVASNMLTDIKTEIHRSTDATVTYSINWSSDQIVSCVSLPCTNLASGALVTVVLKNSSSVVIGTINKTTSITSNPIHNHTVNDFPLGKFTSICLFFTSKVLGVRSCEISIDATGISSGFIDCSKIVIGDYWSPKFNFESGISTDITDSSNISRTNAGELVVDRGFSYDKIDFKYSLLEETDKDILVSILKEVGIHKNFLVVLLPSDSTSSNSDETIFTIYGKRSNTSISHRAFGYYNHSMEITSW